MLGLKRLLSCAMFNSEEARFETTYGKAMLHCRLQVLLGVNIREAVHVYAVECCIIG